MGETFSRCLRTPASDDDVNPPPQVNPALDAVGNAPHQMGDVNPTPQVNPPLDAVGNAPHQMGDVNPTPQVNPPLDAVGNAPHQVGDARHLDEGRPLNNEEFIWQIFCKDIEVNGLGEVNRLGEVISFIDARLKAILNDKSTTGAETSTNSHTVTSSIDCGRRFIGGVLRRALRHSHKILRETGKAVSEMLRVIAPIHWTVAGLGVVAYVLDQMDKVSTNRDECIRILSYMFNLASRVDRLDKEKLKNVVEFIVNGSLYCISRMESNRFRRFLAASSDAEDLKSLHSQIVMTYLDLILDVMLQGRKVSLPVAMGKAPKAVGIGEARNEVVNLLELKDKSKRIVVLYGLGGIGKSTLAKAVLFSLDLSVYKFCRICIEQDGSASPVKLQERVLKDLFNKKIQLRDSEEGKAHIQKLFKEAYLPVFLFIDNALRGCDLDGLLPDDLSCLPDFSRILITIRNGAGMIKQGGVMIEEEGVKSCAYRVKPLSEKASIKFLRLKALGRGDNHFGGRTNIDGLVKICGGLPEALIDAGKKLRNLDTNIVKACEGTTEFFNDTLGKGEGGLIENVVDVVYKNLQEDLYKDAFLDIAAFFYKWDERMVRRIVGALPLRDVQDAALVTISEEGKVILEDVVLARGRKLSEDYRITDHKALRLALLYDTQRISRLKGIWLPSPGDSGELQLENRHLQLMERSLRVLHLSESIRLDGESECTFTDLRFLHINSDLRMELTNLTHLAVLQAYLNNYDGLSDRSRLPNFPDSVYRLQLSGGYCLPLIGEMCSNLSHLEELSLRSSSGSLSDNFCELKFLRLLEIVDCPELTSLPHNFGCLSSLKTLNLTGSRLTSLPDSFGQLSCLEELNISESRELKRLPNSFSDLSLLKNLDISGCSNLRMSPDDLNQLRSVCAVNTSNCPQLHQQGHGQAS